MNIRDQFRKRWLGQMGFTGGEPELVNTPIILSPKDRAENNQSQPRVVRDKVYSPGKPAPRRKRILNG